MAGPGVGFSFRPEFSGEFVRDRLPADLLARIEWRVTTGLFAPGQRARANYRVVSSSRRSLEFEAADPLTAWNVGLNRVQLVQTGPTSISFHVRFDRWARYCVLHGAILATAFVVAYGFLPGLREDLAASPANAILASCLIGFWCLVWPWLLIALHRPFARRALERILSEESERDAASASAA